MGFCPTAPHDLNAPYRIVTLIVGVSAGAMVLLSPLIRRTFHGQGSQAH
jgi:hypothetical protein